jgi:hypothetical protein
LCQISERVNSSAPSIRWRLAGGVSDCDMVAVRLKPSFKLSTKKGAFSAKKKGTWRSYSDARMTQAAANL